MAYTANKTSFAKGQSGNPAGRPRGSHSYRDLVTAQERARLAAEAGCTPLQWLIATMLDVNHAVEIRLDCAKAAAPYMHKKMPIAVEVAGQRPDIDLEKLMAFPPEERRALLASLVKLGVNLGVGAPAAPGGLPVIDPALGSPVHQLYAAADAAGRAQPDSYARSSARISPTLSAALAEASAEGQGVSPLGEPAPRTRRSVLIKKPKRSKG